MNLRDLNSLIQLYLNTQTIFTTHIQTDILYPRTSLQKNETILPVNIHRNKPVIVHLNPLNAELNPICHLLALLGGATIVVVSRLRVKPHRLKRS